ncbi:outer membrane biogenesis protein BamB [Rubinisphaera italica]|uniref:Outer membrane biogenesis protein BamB n=1 Tax=Rubinisphaera italica TaxID=2527969 RepID=A0A5C5XPC5_9PLAN|nr:outer membrane biogenesis protein BamB [Rubinisphaera italica]
MILSYRINRICCLILFLSILNTVGCSGSSVSEPAVSGSSNRQSDNQKSAEKLDYHIRPEFAEREKLGYWPNLAGPDFNSTSQETKLSSDRLSDENRLWTIEIGSGYSTPVVGRDDLYVFYRLGDDEIIECRELLKGGLKWKFGSPTTYECPVEYSNGPYSTPTLDENSLYAIGTESKLYCINRADGELKWLRDLQLDYEPEAWDFPVGSSPLVIDGQIYLNLGGTKGKSAIVALDAESSKTIWTSMEDGRSYATPRYALIHGIPHLIVLTDHYLASLNPEDGAVRWQVEFGVKKSPNRVNAVSPLIVDDKIIATAGPGGGVICLQVEPDGSYKQLWTDRRNLDSQFNNITCVSDSIYGFTSKWNRQALLRCLSLETGEIQWEWSSKLMRGSMIAADGKLYLLGESGEFAVVKLRSDRLEVLLELDEPLLKSPSYSAPVIANGILILRDEHKLQAWNIRESTKE